MRKYIFLALLLSYVTSALGAIPTTSVPVSSSSSTSSTTTLPRPNSPCSDDTDCDDLNPCTYAECDHDDYVCNFYRMPQETPCDDGLFCNGTDNCGDYDGLCSIHAGDPCPTGTVCNEDTDSCDSNSVTSTTTTSNQETSTTTVPTGGSFSISGYVTGAVSEEVALLLAGTSSRAAITDTDGYYQFLNLAGGYYTLKPEKEGYSFEPPNYVIQNLTSDLVDMDFEATKTRCLVQSIYGTDSTETQLLRSIRDNVLSKTHEGRELIKLYYQWSPVIVRAMEADEEFKQEVKELVDELLPLIEGRD